MIFVESWPGILIEKWPGLKACPAVRAWGQAGDFSFLDLGAPRLALNRAPSLPVLRLWRWCVSRSRGAVVILASPNTPAHSLKPGLVVTMTLVRAYSLLGRWKRSVRRL